MYQVFVTAAGQGVIPIGPKCHERQLCDQLAASVEQAIAKGKIHGWKSPMVAAVLAKPKGVSDAEKIVIATH